MFNSAVKTASSIEEEEEQSQVTVLDGGRQGDASGAGEVAAVSLPPGNGDNSDWRAVWTDICSIHQRGKIGFSSPN